MISATRPFDLLRSRLAITAVALFGLAGIGGLSGCAPSPGGGETADEPASDPNGAQGIVDRAIELHGGDLYESTVTEFDFRDFSFEVVRDGGRFEYTRAYSDTSGQIVEIMTNDGFSRTADGEPYEMTEREWSIWTEQVNANVYFTFLPYKLNDPPVIKKLLEPVTIEGEPYNTVEVTFEQEGGGRDWEDRFLFWFHQVDGTMDYFSYFYTLRGTSRFRKLINEREIGGIVFADHLNYNADTLAYDLELAPEWFEAGKLQLASEVILENITVNPVE